MNLKDKFESILHDTPSAGTFPGAYPSKMNHSLPQNSSYSGSWKKILQVFIIAVVIAFLCGLIYLKECYSSKLEEKIKEKFHFIEKHEDNENSHEEEIEETDNDPLFQRF
tara:strand:+ start:259 stop:588 length:330 start_codon:yes stop_codon:yes gene_type:complete